MIEVDHALDLFEFVRCYGELGLQEGLLYLCFLEVRLVCLIYEF